MLLFIKLLILFSGFRLTRQEHYNDVLALNCEAFKEAKQQNDIEYVDWRVKSLGSWIAKCEYGKNIECKVNQSLESKGIKVLNISRTNGALRITRLSPTSTEVFLCTVRTSFEAYDNNVTVDFSVECKLG